MQVRPLPHVEEFPGEHSFRQAPLTQVLVAQVFTALHAPPSDREPASWQSVTSAGPLLTLKA